jgi:hypothetical protein
LEFWATLNAKKYAESKKQIESVAFEEDGKDKV